MSSIEKNKVFDCSFEKHTSAGTRADGHHFMVNFGMSNGTVCGNIMIGYDMNSIL